MRKLVTWSLLSLTLIAFSVPALAQQPLSDCTIGVFTNADGTGQTFLPTQGQIFTVYTVMFVEGVVNAVSYDLLVPQLGQDIFPAGDTFGEGNIGLNIQTQGGYNIGLGECAVGFTGFPIIVAAHSFIMPFETITGRTISLGPNLDSGPESPMFSTCQGEIYPCTISSNLLLEAPVATESVSFGAVKSLYSN